ncbi:bacterial regulatory helix-turn-helix, lysR family protein, partial [Vibrio parahaemolyticus AQ3810]
DFSTGARRHHQYASLVR